MVEYTINIPSNVILEIEEYYNYIFKENPNAANHWLYDIEENINSLSSDPERCPYALENKYHKYEIRNLIYGNYRILFRIRNQIIEILHIKHAKMKIKPINTKI